MMRQQSTKQSFISLVIAFGFVAWSPPAASQDAFQGHRARSDNVRLLGHDDLQGRSAYHPVIKRQIVDGRERWIAYMGHHAGEALNPLTGEMQSNGTSIVDVTDPQNPVYLHHIETSYGASGAQMVRVCTGDELPGGEAGKAYLLRSNGGFSRATGGSDGNVSHQIFDVTDPGAPRFLSLVSEGLVDTHKSWWECDTGIAYIVSGVPGWRVNRMTQVYDLSDPQQPKFIRNFGLPGQQPGATGEVPEQIHGCISVVQANRVYCGYGTNQRGAVVILDRDKLIRDSLVDPANPSEAELRAPIMGALRLPDFMGAHTTFPILDVPIAEFAKHREYRVRDFVAVVNEAAANECTQDARQMMFMVDVTVESRPWPVSNYNVPESEGNYCERGGRFGAHASNESFTPIYYGKLIFVSWFNAGVRVVDIRDPFNPTEAGYYIPATTDATAERCITVDDEERCKIAIQTNNVEVDERGYIYLADRANTGMHILELAGEAREIADLPISVTAR